MMIFPKKKTCAAMLLLLLSAIPQSGTGQPCYFGNQAVVWGEPATFSLSDNAARAFIRFTARQSAPITEVQLYFGAVTGSPRYVVSLQPDSGGTPSGVPIAGTTSFSPSGPSWSAIPLSAPASVSAGNVYDLVIQWDDTSAALGTGNSAVLMLATSPANFIYPFDQAPDSQLGAGEDAGSGAWAFITGEPVFLVNYSGQWSGNPNTNWGSLGNAPNSLWWETFQVPSPITISSVGCVFYARGTPPSNMNWGIVDNSSGATLGNGILATPASAGVSAAWTDVSIPPLVIPAGTFRLELTSTAFVTMGPPTIWNGFMVNEAGVSQSSPYEDLTYGGVSSFFGSGLGGGGGSPGADLFFRFQVACSPTPSPTATPSPTVVFPAPGIFYVSQNAFNPGQGPLTLIVECPYSDGLGLRIYNSAGENIKNIELPNPMPAGPVTLAWDGNNQGDEKCASGLYVLRFMTPSGPRHARVLLAR